MIVQQDIETYIVSSFLSVPLSPVPVLDDLKKKKTSHNQIVLSLPNVKRKS